MNEFLEKIKLLYKSLEKYKNNKENLLSLNLNTIQNTEADIIINRLDKINNKILEISNDIDELQNDIDKNELNKTTDIENRVKQNKINNHIYNHFLPYMLTYNFILNNIDDKNI